MYNLYDKYLRGNSIGCCPLYVGYYLLYVLTWELNRYGRRRRRTTTTHFKSFLLIDSLVSKYFSIYTDTENGCRFMNASTLCVYT